MQQWSHGVVDELLVTWLQLLSQQRNFTVWLMVELESEQRKGKHGAVWGKREKPTAYNFIVGNGELFDFLPEDVVKDKIRQSTSVEP